jgi:hypothetical protein
MSLLEMLPEIRTLSRGDKLRLIQLLAEELAANEGNLTLVAGQEYPVWSPDSAFAAADTLMEALREDQGTGP